MLLILSFRFIHSQIDLAANPTKAHQMRMSPLNSNSELLMNDDGDGDDITK